MTGLATGRTELAITGMTCASCVAHVGRALRRVPGVSQADVNLATERATVAHAAQVEAAALVAAVVEAGYEARPVDPEAVDDDARERDEEFALKRRLLILAVALLVPILVLGMFAPGFTGKDWIVLALTLPVWLIVGSEFHRGAISALRHGTSNMDTLVSLGSTVALGYSIYATIVNQPSYYETAAAIVTLVFIGKYLEAAAKTKSNRAIRALLDLRPAIARVRDAAGIVHESPVESVRAGDTLLIAAGERIPVDGIVEEGQSAIDVSMLTGEPIPAAVAPGDAVSQGTLNGAGALVITASAVGAGTRLARIIEAVRRAQGTAPNVQRLADTAAGIFVPTILMVAAATFAAWIFLHHPWPIALSAAIAVLVVACPCALGLATPTAIMVAVGIGARHGILFRDASAIERLSEVSTVFFDKTGTLTAGKPQVLGIRAADGATQAQVLEISNAIEGASTHPLAQAVARAARDAGAAAMQAGQVVAYPGAGLKGIVAGSAVLAGNERFMRESGVALDGFPAGEDTRVYVAKDGRLLGAIDFGDTVRPQAGAAISDLHALGATVHLVSGDASEPTRKVAELLQIDDWHARVSPEGKAALVTELQTSGQRAAFVGDGINDAPALASAYVGLAMGGGTEIALESAHAAILSNDPRAVAEGVRLSRMTVRTIRQNVFWAFAYNAILVPLAAAGIVHPILAAGAMGASSLFVVGNALLLQRRGWTL